MLISYHNHTRWSDGAPTLAGQIQGARAVGLDELGISDHLVLVPGGGPVSWSMDPDLLPDYVLELRAAREEVRGLVLRLGIEADYIPETVAATRDLLSEQPLDYVIGSVHYVDGWSIDGDAREWDALSPGEREEVWRRYWTLIRAMALSGVYDVAAHLDLPKKFGHRPAGDLSSLEDAALDALAEAGMALEINTAGWSLPAREAYPSLSLLRRCRTRNIPLQINADAHFPEHLTRDFDRAFALAREAGYDSLIRYECRRGVAFPLPGADWIGR